jgi:hypothetical protein
MQSIISCILAFFLEQVSIAIIALKLLNDFSFDVPLETIDFLVGFFELLAVFEISFLVSLVVILILLGLMPI